MMNATSNVTLSAAAAAIAFVGNDNRTYLGCEAYGGGVSGLDFCEGIMEHTRGTCQKGDIGGGNMTFTCSCFRYGGLTPPGNREDAPYVFGKDACSTRQWSSYMNFVLQIITVSVLTAVLCFGCYTFYAGRKKLAKNITCVTLFMVTGAAFGHWLWHLAVFLSNSVLLTDRPMVIFQKPICIPLFTIFEVFALLSFPLMWIQIVNKTKKMAKAGATLDKKPTIIVAVSAGILGVMFIIFGILELTFLSSAIGAALFLLSIVIYLVGSFKLQKTVGKGNKTAVAVGKLTRNIACSLVLSVLGTASFTVISPRIDAAPYDMVPVGMIVANFLMPMGFTSGHFLLIQFIFNSLTRKKGQAKGGVAATQAGSTTVGNDSAGSTKAPKDTSISAVHPKVTDEV